MAINPVLTLPSLKKVIPGSMTDITGVDYSDSFAAANPGFMYLSVSDSLGSLTAIDSAGHLGGPGQHTITLSASYADVTAVLHSLAYTAPTGAGSDTLRFDIWNQAGVETTGSIPVSIVAALGKTETWTGAVSSDWNTPANWSGNAVPTTGDTLNIPGGTPNSAALANAILSAETITLSNNAAVSFSNVTLDSLLQVTGLGSLQIAGALTIGSQGRIEPEQGGTLVVHTTGNAVPIVNNGVLRAPARGILTINNGGTGIANSVTLQNNGIISADGGNVSFDFAPPPFGTAPPETLINAGSIIIANGGSLTLNGTFAGNDVAFNGAGALGLQVGNAFAGDSHVTGFGQGDQIDLYGIARGAPLGFTNGILSEGTSAVIPLAGSYGLGNFTDETIGGAGNPQIVGYTSDGGASGIVQPDIVAPASASVAQGSTLSLGSVFINNLGNTSDTLNITAVSGMLYMNGASGSGTNHLSLGSTSPDQIEADLATLSYVPAPGASADIVTIGVSPPAPVLATRSIPISITSGPGLHEPSSIALAPNATHAVSGSYDDAFAQHNPGQLYLGISDSNGTLRATDAAGNPVTGSGTNYIGVSTDYINVNAVLRSLTYTAGATGNDAISFDVWNQAGVETTGTVPIQVTATAATPQGGPSFIAPTAVTMAGALDSSSPDLRSDFLLTGGGAGPSGGWPIPASGVSGIASWLEHLQPVIGASWPHGGWWS